ncbi:tetratricopeptide repeat protein [Pseudomonas lini]
MNTYYSGNHYNPDWLSDDELVANFIVRQEEFSFLQDELKRAPLKGSVQHYILIGLRGAGKTTLLKRIAVAVRRESFLSDHLIAISFPEELYQVKNLSDFWFAACESLADELDYLNYASEADVLLTEISSAKRSAKLADHMSDIGFSLLQRFCDKIGKRAVLLVDNLDMVFQRIDKTGRKLNDPLSPAYWAMRELLSTETSPIVIGGSVRLSEPFTDYEKAFYDFFIPKRLGRLDLTQVRVVLEQLADRNNEPELKARLNKKKSRLEALYDLTGGNPRAIGLIFELLKSGPNSRAIHDFQRLMDITTPYYKARFEDISEQAQVVMHALAVRRPDSDKMLRFGHTASELAEHSGLPTGTISAQLASLENEGLVEKNKTLGRAQYRISEQLFRLWLQMRGSRRIRQNVMGLTDFLEAMYDAEELQVNLNTPLGVSQLAEAQFAFAVAGVQNKASLKRSFETHGADRVFKFLEAKGGDIGDYLPAGDLSEDLESVTRLREQLRVCGGGGLSSVSQKALLGSIKLSPLEKNTVIECLSGSKAAPYDLNSVQKLLDKERFQLIADGMCEGDLILLFSKRSKGFLPLPNLTPEEVELAELSDPDKPRLRSMVWRLLGARNHISLGSMEKAREWILWGEKYLADAHPNEWARVAGAFRRAKLSLLSEQALDHAEAMGPCARSLYERALHAIEQEEYLSAESLLRKSIDLNSEDPFPWIALAKSLAKHQERFEDAVEVYEVMISKFPENTGAIFKLAWLLANKLQRYSDAVVQLQKIVSIDPLHFNAWLSQAMLIELHLDNTPVAEIAVKKALSIKPDNIYALKCYGYILSKDEARFSEAIDVHRKLVELEPQDKSSWAGLGAVLSEHTDNYEEAVDCFRRAIEIDDTDPAIWQSLAQIFTDHLSDPEESEKCIRKILDLDPENDAAFNNLGLVLAKDPARWKEAEEAFRASIAIDPESWIGWSNLGIHLAEGGRIEEAEPLFRHALLLDNKEYSNWLNLGNLLSEKAEGLESTKVSFSQSVGVTSEEVMVDAGSNTNEIIQCWEEAGISYVKAAEIDSLNPEPLLHLGVVFNKVGKDAEAEAAFRKALELNPDSASLLRTLGGFLVHQTESTEEAEFLLKKSLKIDPDSSNAWNSLGTLKAGQGFYSEAAAHYERSIELDPNFDAAWVNYGHMLSVYLDRPEEAIEAYTKALELNSTDAGVWNNFGILLSKVPERLDESEAAYRKAISIDPTLVQPWQNLFRFLRGEGRVSDADNLYAESQKFSLQSDEYWREFNVYVKVTAVLADLTQAVTDDDLLGLERILGELLSSSEYVKDIAVSGAFVEGFLSEIVGIKAIAVEVVKILKSNGFERDAKPLLLALEAAIASDSESIDNLEPELRSATRHMFDRLVGEI